MNPPFSKENCAETTFIYIYISEELRWRDLDGNELFLDSSMFNFLLQLQRGWFWGWRSTIGWWQVHPLLFRFGTLWLFFCHSRCRSCKEGGYDDGGVVLENGVCTRWCSVSNYCGKSPVYKTNGSVDCGPCDHEAFDNLTKLFWLRRDCAEKSNSASTMAQLCALSGSDAWGTGLFEKVVRRCFCRSSKLYIHMLIGWLHVCDLVVRWGDGVSSPLAW